MARISNIKAREILDSRGNPTLEVDVFLDDGSAGRASVPAGASKGGSEAVELRDADPDRYHGLGVLKAVANVDNIINDKLQGMQADQHMVDEAMIKLDGTPNKKNLGANSILAVSLATAKATAISYKMPLYQYLTSIAGLQLKKKGDPFPSPYLVLINGGVHAKNNLDFQEILVSPTAKPFSNQLQISVEIFQALTEVLVEKAYTLALGDEGGYGPDFLNNEDSIKVVLEAVERAGYIPERDIVLGMDLAADTFYKAPKYIFENEKKNFTVDELISYYRNLVKLYPIKLMEDPLSDEDWEGWKKLHDSLEKDILLIGDDIFATNSERLSKGIQQKVAEAVIIKPNQIGTLTETLLTVKIAKKARYKVIVSHRSGETCDPFIADLAFAVGAQYIKAGAPERGERVAKYNRLLEIEEEL